MVEIKKDAVAVKATAFLIGFRFMHSISKR